jgi:hypothetical protein
MSLDEALFERGAMYSPAWAVQKYVNEYGKKEFIDGYDLGYIDGLNAAREAVFGAKAIDIAYGRGLDEPAQFIWLNNALAAIDALREESND